MKKVLISIFAVLLCLALVACAAPSAPVEEAPAPVEEAPAPVEEAPADAETYKVAISLPPADNAWQAALLGSIQEAVAGDTQIEWTVKNAVDNADQQNILTTFKDGGYDVIACLPGDGTLMTTIMEEIYDSGIPTIIIDRNIASDKYTSFVAEDNYSCGAMAADFIGAPTVIPIHYNTWEKIAQDAKEFARAINETTDMKVVILEPGKGYEISAR